jgi:hydrogenase maturation factor
VAVNANDVAVSGARPRGFLMSVVFPLGTTEEDVEALFADVRRALASLGCTLVGGHSEVNRAVTQPIVVGQMLGLADPSRLTSSAGARPGDVLVQVGPVPVEGAAVLANGAEPRLAAVDPEIVRRAAAAVDDPGISVVRPALAAAEAGATAHHDPTEGGIAGALHELAQASRAQLRVARNRISWFEPGVVVCEALGADPWATLASGSLLATFPPRRADDAVAGLLAVGHAASVIGTVEEGSGVFDDDGGPIAWPLRDEVSRVLD